MRIAIASGKGGTGKTMVAVNLAAVITQKHLSNVTLLDCDVETPNAALFLHPWFTQTWDVKDNLPWIDHSKCMHCGMCATVCQFNALLVTPSHTLFFPELCHACGSCARVCPQQAIDEIPSHIGIIREGIVKNIHFYEGEMDIGHSSPVKVIQSMISIYNNESFQENIDSLTIIDSPPGVTCPTVSSLQDSDYVILVTEPTPFGLHDLKMAVQLVRNEMHLQAGIVINKDDGHSTIIEEFCQENRMAILARFPFSRYIAEIYARGQLLTEIEPGFVSTFISLLEKIQRSQHSPFHYLHKEVR